jgi:hypothetical protein
MLCEIKHVAIVGVPPMLQQRRPQRIYLLSQGPNVGPGLSQVVGEQLVFAFQRLHPLL